MSKTTAIADAPNIAATHTDTVIGDLRASRAADDILAKLQEGSLETLRARVAKTLGPDFQIQATYGKVNFVLGRTKDGSTVRLPVTETDDQIKIGKAEVFEIALPANDVATEMLATAEAAALALLEDEDPTTRVAPMLKSMTKALDVSGDLSRRMGVALECQSLTKRRWYHQIVSEHYTTPITLPNLVQEGEVTTENVAQALDNLANLLITEMAQTTQALRAASLTPEQESVLTPLAESVLDDLKRATAAITNTSRTSPEEMTRTYEAILPSVARLIAGARFLAEQAGAQPTPATTTADANSPESVSH